MAHYKDLFTDFKEDMDDWSYKTNEWDTPVEKRVKSLKAIVWLPLCAPSSQTDNASIQSQWKRLHWPACSASRHATLEPRHFWSGLSLCLAKASTTSTSGSSSNTNSRPTTTLESLSTGSSINTDHLYRYLKPYPQQQYTSNPHNQPRCLAKPHPPATRRSGSMISLPSSS
jgi:hypothetical protein